MVWPETTYLSVWARGGDPIDRFLVLPEWNGLGCGFRGHTFGSDMEISLELRGDWDKETKQRPYH